VAPKVAVVASPQNPVLAPRGSSVVSPAPVSPVVPSFSARSSFYVPATPSKPPETNQFLVPPHAQLSPIDPQLPNTLVPVVPCPPVAIPPLVLPDAVVSNRSIFDVKKDALTKEPWVKVWWPDDPAGWRNGKVVGESIAKLGGTHDVIYKFTKKGKPLLKYTISENLLGTGSNAENVHWRVSTKERTSSGPVDSDCDSPPVSATSSSSSSSDLMVIRKAVRYR
jgi:hypothetical protein